MNSQFRFILAFLALVPVSSRVVEADESRWKLVWSDEFDGKAIDKTKWDFDTGNGFYNYEAGMWIGGWGNDELQYYTRDPENAFVDGGFLHIKALKESFQGCGYTSARIKSRKRDGSPLFSKAYGRFEFRVKCPAGRGVWPAVWLLPQNEKYGTWPSSGEVDILEARGQEPNKILGTLHFGARWPSNTQTSQDFDLPKPATIAEFHVYALEWEPGEFRWYFDGKLFAQQNFWWSSSKTEKNQGLTPRSEADLNPWPAPFDQAFYIVMNVAVGGRFLGNPDASTNFPAEMLVDYVRVYDSINPATKVKPRGPGKLPFKTP